MATFLLICLIAGSIGAILQGMIGVGTGIIIVPLLTLILPYYGMPQAVSIHIAIATSMAAIATNSITALISHYKRGNINWNVFKEIILFTMIGSFIGALVASQLTSKYLQIIFCIFLFGNAIYMLVKTSKTDDKNLIPKTSFAKMMSGGLGIGMISSFVGSGGGLLMVPFLHSCKLQMRNAVGTSTLISFPVAVIGAVTYAYTGFAKLPNTMETIGYLHWPAFLAITVAGLLCAPIGVRLAAIIHSHYLQRLFAICLIIIAIKMVVNL